MRTSRFLTRFNPRPVATETISIPVFATVPNTAKRQDEAAERLAGRHLPARPHP